MACYDDKFSKNKQTSFIKIKKIHISGVASEGENNPTEGLLLTGGAGHVTGAGYHQHTFILWWCYRSVFMVQTR